MEDKAWEVELLRILERNMSPEEFFWNQMQKRGLKIDIDTIDVLLVYLVHVKEIDVDTGLQIKHFVKKCMQKKLIKE
jgi:hypothetical protein